MKRLMLFMFLFWAAVINNAQTVVSPYDTSLSFPVGVVYSLPKVVLEITVEAECVVEKTGPFYQYAERYLSEPNVITKDKKEWKLTDVKIRNKYIADQDRRFVVEVNKKGVAPFVRLNKEGVIEGVNMPMREKNVPVVKDANGFKKPKAPKIKEHRNCAENNDVNVSFDYTVLGEEALVANSIPRMAEMAAKQIYRIRESRAALMMGDLENVSDGKAAEVMLKEMDAAEKELVALFVGKRVIVRDSKKLVYDVEDDIENHILFRMSINEGILPYDNLLGAPIYLNLKGKHLVPPTMSKKESRAKKGFYYVVPGAATVTITDNSDFERREECIVPQFGYTAFLPSKLTDSDVTVLFTKEGAIHSIYKNKQNTSGR